MTGTTAESRATGSTEQTPLLRDNNVEAGPSQTPGDGSDEGPDLPQELSFPKLAAVMIATWVGDD
jgi:hypothetical protein